MNEYADEGVVDADDVALLEELREAGRLDVPSAESIAAAKSSFVWRTLDAELAELVYDSVLEESALAVVRSSQPPQLLTFEAPALTIEIEAATSGTRRRLVGQLVPPQPGRIEVRHSGGTVTVDADEMGRFTADDLTPGPVSLRYYSAGTSVGVTTDWVLV
ncbi:MAG: hypothetical protein ACRD12_16180 [Acidimicrobiales bacterium]